MGSWDEPELIGVEPAQTSTSEIRGGAGGGGKAFAAIIVVCAIGLFLLQRTSSDSGVDPDQQETTGETVPDSSTTAPPTTSSRAAQPSTTREVNPAAGALFGYHTGWDLLIGGEGPLISLDLDSGAHEEFARRQVPMGVIGDRLLVSYQSSDRIGHVPLDSLDDGPINLEGANVNGWPYGDLVPGPTEGTVWLPSGYQGDSAWQLWDFNDEPTPIREVPAPTVMFGPNSVHPEILGSPAGGVFLFVDDRLERVADGRLMTVTTRHAVVEQCSTPFDCETVWLDRSTWQVDSKIRTPEIQNPFFLFGMAVSPDGKRAFIPDFQTGRGMLWNLETGESEHDGFVEGGSFSPDSRFAAGMVQSGKVMIIDTETGQVAEWQRPGSNWYARVLFVAN